jgi:hypothetical protein
VRLLPPTSLISVNPNARPHSSFSIEPPPPLDNALFAVQAPSGNVKPRRPPGRPRIVRAPGELPPRRRKKVPPPTPAVSDNAAAAAASGVSGAAPPPPAPSTKSDSKRVSGWPGLPRSKPAPSESGKRPVPQLSLAEELDELPIDMILHENDLLIAAIKEMQSIDAERAVAMQQQLHFNLMYLLSVDSTTESAPAVVTESASTDQPAGGGAPVAP